VAARLPHAHRPEVGSALPVAVPAQHLHFFDPATGLRAN
jgi:sn-glycerol 3-phosphate transport system ATP-binding protein